MKEGRRSSLWFFQLFSFGFIIRNERVRSSKAVVTLLCCSERPCSWCATEGIQVSVNMAGSKKRAAQMQFRLAGRLCWTEMDYYASPFVPYQLTDRIDIGAWNCFLQEMWNSASSGFCPCFDQQAASLISEIYAPLFAKRCCVLRFDGSRFTLEVQLLEGNQAVPQYQPPKPKALVIMAAANSARLV